MMKKLSCLLIGFVLCASLNAQAKQKEHADVIPVDVCMFHYPSCIQMFKADYKDNWQTREKDQAAIAVAINNASIAINVCLTLTDIDGTLRRQPHIGEKLSSTVTRFFCLLPLLVVAGQGVILYYLRQYHSRKLQRIHGKIDKKTQRI